MPDFTCRWPDCERTAWSRGLCSRDYARAKRLGSFEAPWNSWNQPDAPQSNTNCRWPECQNPAAYAGLCSRDYSRAKRLGNRVDPWTEWDTSGSCPVCGKPWESGRNLKKGFCSDSCRMTKWREDNPEQARATKSDSTRRRRARLVGVKVEKFTTHDVRMTRGDDCYLCGKRINYKLRFPHPQSPSLDHVIPISAGGAHSLANVAMAHMGCNNQKNSRPTSQVPLDTLFTI